MYLALVWWAVTCYKLSETGVRQDTHPTDRQLMHAGSSSQILILGVQLSLQREGLQAYVGRCNQR